MPCPLGRPVGLRGRPSWGRFVDELRCVLGWPRREAVPGRSRRRRCFLEAPGAGQHSRLGRHREPSTGLHSGSPKWGSLSGMCLSWCEELVMPACGMCFCGRVSTWSRSRVVQKGARPAPSAGAAPTASRSSSSRPASPPCLKPASSALWLVRRRAATSLGLNLNLRVFVFFHQVLIFFRCCGP